MLSRCKASLLLANARGETRALHLYFFLSKEKAPAELRIQDLTDYTISHSLSFSFISSLSFSEDYPVKSTTKKVCRKTEEEAEQ